MEDRLHNNMCRTGGGGGTYPNNLAYNCHRVTKVKQSDLVSIFCAEAICVYRLFYMRAAL